MYLVVRVRFLAGYEGREWPPSPARLFKALVAVSRHGIADADLALEWLEKENAPTVLASRASVMRSRLRRFVPNNSEVDPKTGNAEWPAARVSKEPEKLHAWRLDPPAEVAYVWSVAGRSAEADIVAAIAHRVPSLGKGEDFVVTRAGYADEIPSGLIRYEPRAKTGAFDLEVPDKGCLSVCCDLFRRRAADPGWNKIHELPTMGTHLEAYATAASEDEGTQPPIAVFGLWKGGSRRAFDARLLRIPVGQCRHLLATAVSEAATEMASDPAQREVLVRLGQGLLCGHAAGGEKYEGPHAAVVPLPSVLGPHPDGMVRRVALVGFGCAERRALELFETVATLLHERELIDDGVATGVRLRREDDQDWLSLLTRRATVWESVTPVVLERPEFRRKQWEELRHNQRRREARASNARSAQELDRAIAERREELVRAAVDRLGIGEVVDVESSRAPWRAGAHAASQYRTAGYLRQSPRFHVRVTFRDPVPGPVIVGRGRYMGFGLMRPLAQVAAG
jgi:CRISPR-associated protein Csb2